MNGLIELDANEELCDRFKAGAAGQYELLNTKLQSIERILQDDNIKDKQGLIQNIQSMRDIEEITKFIDEKGIKFDPNMNVGDTITLEEIKKYNNKNASIQWDNTEIVEYIETHKEEIRQTREKKTTKFKTFMEKTMIKINNLFDNAGKFANKLFGKEEIKLLPESKGSVESDLKSWDLANYGVNKEKFVEENMRFVEEYIGKEYEQATNIENNETHEIE